MLKRLFLILLMAASFVGCSKKNKPTITAKLVTDGLGINDKSYNANAWDGFLRFYGDTIGEETGFGTLYDLVICNSPANYYSDLRAISEQGHDVLVLTSYSFVDTVRMLAGVFPNQKYLLIDGQELPFDNVMNCIFSSEEGSFLVGVLAALQAQAEGVSNPRFGFVGGIMNDMIRNFEVGYVQGVRHVFPEAEIYDVYVDDWARPDRAAEKTKIWYDNDVYAVYSAAGMSGNGTIAQAVAHRKAGKNVWAIGVDKDQFEEGIYGLGKSAVLTSMIKRVDNAVESCLKNIQNGRFKGGSHVLTLKDGAVGFTTTNQELAASSVKYVNSLQSDLIIGKINAISTYENSDIVDSVLATVHHETPEKWD